MTGVALVSNSALLPLFPALSLTHEAASSALVHPSSIPSPPISLPLFDDYEDDALLERVLLPPLLLAPAAAALPLLLLPPFLSLPLVTHCFPCCLNYLPLLPPFFPPSFPLSRLSRGLSDSQVDLRGERERESSLSKRREAVERSHTHKGQRNSLAREIDVPAAAVAGKRGSVCECERVY